MSASVEIPLDRRSLRVKLILNTVLSKLAVKRVTMILISLMDKCKKNAERIAPRIFVAVSLVSIYKCVGGVASSHHMMAQLASPFWVPSPFVPISDTSNAP